MKKLGSLVLAAILSVVFVLPQPVKADGAYILLSKYSGQAGSIISVNGEGFNSSEVVSLYIGVDPVAVTSASASVTGSFGPVSIMIPETAVPESKIDISARSSSSSSAAVSFYTQAYYPALSVSSTGITPLSKVTVGGSGFAANENIMITMSDFITETAKADSQGMLKTLSFTIPKVAAGSYTIDAIGAASKGKATAYFYVGAFYPNIFPSSFYLIPGQTLSFNGGGFAPNELVSVLIDSKVVAEFNVAADGSYKDAGAYEIPTNTLSGNLHVVLSGELSGSQVVADIAIGKFNPQVFPSSYFVRPGDIISFSGIDFAPYEAIRVYEGENALSLNIVFADAKGSFVANNLGFTIPAEFASTKRAVRIVGEVSQIALDLSIAVGKFTPQLAPSSYYIKAGQNISVDGWDFLPQETVDVTLLGTPAGIISANKTGNIKFGPVAVPFRVKDFELAMRGQSSGGLASLSIPISSYFPTVTASSYYLQAGDEIHFYGGAFAPSEAVNVSVKSSGGSASLGTINTNPDGYLLDNAFSIDFGTPMGQSIYSFQGADSSDVSNLTIEVAPFNPLISSSNYYPMPGSAIKIWASGFGPSEELSVNMNGTKVGSVIADKVGSAGPVQLQLPLKGKTALISVTGSLSHVSKDLNLFMASFSPVVSPSTYYTLPGNQISFSGWGFAPNENVSIASGSDVIGSAMTDATGKFQSGQFTIPFDSGDAVAYSFTGENSEQTYSTTVSLGKYNPYVLLSVYYGSGGTINTVSGFDFAPTEEVDVLFGEAVQSMVMTNSKGAFSLDLTMPQGIGTSLVSAIGKLSGAVGKASFIFAK